MEGKQRRFRGGNDAAVFLIPWILASAAALREDFSRPPVGWQDCFLVSRQSSVTFGSDI